MAINNLLYSGVVGVVKIMHRAFYKEVHIVGRENVPVNSPCLIAANHQNAFMDPLAIICTSGLSPVFLSRSDIFSNAFARMLFRGMRMLPVYRQQDGGNLIAKNAATFSEINDLLSNRESVALFPEATHWAFRRLRPIKKGIARMAFNAQVAHDWKLDLKVLPTGIYYSRYTDVKTNLLVSYGKPIEVSKYKNAYEKNPELAIRQLTKEVSEAMKSEIIHIPSTEAYSTVYEVSDFYSDIFCKDKNIEGTLENKVEAKKELANTFMKVYEDKQIELKLIHQAIVEFKQEVSNEKLKLWLFQNQSNLVTLRLQTAQHLILFPLFVIGVLLNIVPMWLPQVLVKRFVPDHHFHSSFKFGISFLLFPVNFLIVGFGIGVFINSFLYGCLCAITGAITANFTLTYLIDGLKLIGSWRYIKYKQYQNTSVLYNRYIEVVTQLRLLLRKV